MSKEEINDDPKNDFVKKRVQLVNDLNNINLELSSISKKDNSIRPVLIARKDKLVKELQVLNSNPLSKGASMNDVFRDVVNQCCTKDVMGNILREVHSRMSGNPPQYVSLYSEQEERAFGYYNDLDQKFKKLHGSVSKLKKRIYESMPNISETMDNHEYRRRIELLKMLQSFLKELE